MDETISYIESLIRKKDPCYVVTPNVDHIVRFNRSKRFQEIYEKAKAGNVVINIHDEVIFSGVHGE